MRFAVFIMSTLMLSVTAGLAAEDRGAPKKAARGPHTEVLEARGLRKQGTAYVLVGELELGKLAREVAPLQRAVLDASKLLTQAEELEAQRQEEIDECTRRQAELAGQISTTTNSALRNNIILQSNALISRLKQLYAATDIEKTLTKSRERSASAREAFVERVLKMRTVADQLEQDYAALREDAEVTQAVAAAGAAEGKKMTLGPTAGYKANLASLKKLEAKVLTESIKLRRDRQTFYVNVVVGGKPPCEFVVDTGASTVTLPAKLAAELDLTPDQAAPRIHCVLADGKEVEGRRVIAKSLRVSSFTVDNVECVVLPADLANAPALLGMTFLNNYNCRINTEAGTMTLTKVDTGGRPTPKSKKPAKPN